LDKVVNKFKRRYKIAIDTKCWIWADKSIMTRGYPMICVMGNRNFPAKRLSLYIDGRINLNEKGIYIRQSCLNRLCVNPDHLVLYKFKTK